MAQLNAARPYYTCSFYCPSKSAMMSFSLLLCTIPTLLYCTGFTVFYCTVPYHIVLYCTQLPSPILYCTNLHYINTLLKTGASTLLFCIRPDCVKTSRSVSLLILLHPDRISVLTSTPPYQAISEVAVPTTLALPLLCLLVLAVVNLLWV